MSDSTASLRRKIGSAGDLQSVVRTMKAPAASSIGQYEKSVYSLAQYRRTIELGLGACLRANGPAASVVEKKGSADTTLIGAIVFGSDQGLVGQFNEAIVDYALKTLASFGGKPQIWVVGERVHARLVEAGQQPIGLFAVPNSIKAIAPLIGQIQIESETHRARGDYQRVYVFHNRPESRVLYEPVGQRLPPLDQAWQQTLVKIPWPNPLRPEVMSSGTTALRALIREYLFISLYQSCAEPLASENASRLAAMERADRNIDNLLENLQGVFNRLRQSSIDEELFDVISGYEALSSRPGRARLVSTSRSL